MLAKDFLNGNQCPGMPKVKRMNSIAISDGRLDLPESMMCEDNSCAAIHLVMDDDDKDKQLESWTKGLITYKLSVTHTNLRAVSEILSKLSHHCCAYFKLKDMSMNQSKNETFRFVRKRDSVIQETEK